MDSTPSSGYGGRADMADIVLTTNARTLEVQIDLDLVAGDPISGFHSVPVGPHRLSIRSGEHWHHEWVRVEGTEETVAVIVDGAATSRAGDEGLARFPTSRAAHWEALTANLSRHRSQAELANNAEGSRLDSSRSGALGGETGRHRLARLVRDAGSTGRFLAEVERSFLDGFLTPDTGDLDAIARWRYLVGALGAGGDEEFGTWPDLFPAAIATLESQVELLGVDLLDDSLVYELDFLAAELLRSTDPGLGLAGFALERLLGR
ncbi:MAG: hypothetical protein JWO62_1578 [Acidimicrobiaceae bacterium]|nr:hypothetical protein [Acidimicrobiaceae bacterium]